MPRRRITFRQLETFAHVARLGSFTWAADALHLTQPAISIQIRQIADTLGLPLFEQIGRDISLTPAGELLLQATRELDDVWNRFESDRRPQGAQARQAAGGAGDDRQVFPAADAWCFLPALIRTSRSSWRSLTASASSSACAITRMISTSCPTRRPTSTSSPGPS